jgi:hypothetical protein
MDETGFKPPSAGDHATAHGGNDRGTVNEMPKAYTVAEAAGLLRVCANTIYRHQDEFHAFKVGGRLFIPAWVIEDRLQRPLSMAPTASAASRCASETPSA